ncbi:hypothetical protein ACIQ7N_02015 [Lysinibacillus sp. NPDC095746]|uniref:hypothetical protein n=1 Tax=Lysinibacillus sp. NPDC095746 TaxID=3364134 RepID=UPI0037FF78D6
MLQQSIEIIDDKFNIVLCDEPIGEYIALENVMAEIIILKKEKIKLINYKYESEKLSRFINLFAEKNKENLHPDYLNYLEIGDDLNNISFEDRFNLVILGAEKFCEIEQTASAVTENYIGDSASRLFGVESLNVSEKIMESWNKYKDNESLLTITMFFEVSPKKANELLKEYENHDFISITSLLTGKQELDIQKIILELSNRTLKESLNYINEVLSKKLPRENICLLRFIVYLQNGYLEEALNVLKGIFEKLNNNEIVIFCNVLISQKKYSEAFNLLKSIYEKDKWTIGLFPALIKASVILEFEKREKIIEDILLLVNDDLYILQESGNFFWSIKNYKRAGEIYRKIFNISSNRYFDMMARIAELMSNVPDNVNVAEGYMHALLQNDQLDNEIYYRTALICKNIFKSNYKYYQNLSKVEINEDFPFSKDVITRRLDILKDEIKIIDCLKVKVDRETKQIINKDLISIKDMRLNTILNGIEYLFLDDQGFVDLQEFIDFSQSEEIWYQSLIKLFENEIENWKIQSIDSVRDSIISKELEELGAKPTFEQLFSLVRDLRELEDSNEEKLKVANGALGMAMSFNDILKESYIRFEVGLFLTYIGEYQKANEHALNLLHRYNREQDKAIKTKLLILGLSVWAVSQYRSGRKVDGILCTIVVMRKALVANEYYAIESSLNILFLFLSNDLKIGNTKNIRLKLTNFKTSFVTQIKEGMQVSSPVEIENALLNKDWDTAKKLLMSELGNFDLMDVYDATNFVNYINSLYMLGQVNEAYSLILEKSNDVLKLFEMRLDNRWKVCYQFVQIIFKQIMNDDYKENSDLLMEIMDMAINDMEIQRKSMFHIQERAAYTEETQNVYKVFLKIAAFADIISKKRKHKNIWEDKLIKLIFKTSSISLLEKKFTDTKISEEAEKKAEEYFRLYEELLNIKVDFESEEYRKKTETFESLHAYLIKEHYSFRSLIQMEEIDLNLVQSLLHENEVFYEYRITDDVLVSLLVTKQSYKLSTKILKFKNLNEDSNESLNEVLNNIGLILSLSDDRDSKNLEIIEYLCESLSKFIYGDFIEYIENLSSQINLIVCPDMSIPYFTPSLMRHNGEWVITKINKINNILSVNELKYRNKKNKLNNNDFLISIGSKSSGNDTSIPLAEEWYENNKEFFKDRINDIEAFSNIENEKNLFLIIIAHGIEEVGKKRGTTGAVRILGPEKKYLENSFFSEIAHKLNVLFLLTCQSGQPSTNNIQKAETIWKTIVSQNCSSILCRWDVGAKPGLIVLECYRDSEDNFIDNAEILINAQKKLLSSDEFNIPSEWACFEYWGLE